MILASVVLVVVAAAALVIGVFNSDTLGWIYACIGCCIAAGLLLVARVLRARTPTR